MVRLTVSKTKKGKPPVEPETPPPEPETPPPGDPVSGTFKGTVTPTGGEAKEVEGEYSGTADAATGEFNVMGILIAPSPPVGGVSSITQNNITVNFASPRAVFQNFLGDWFIQGPVTVSSISPAPTGSGITRRNGAMVNPNNAHQQAFDGRFTAGYTTTGAYTVGTQLNAGDSLICSESRNPEMTFAELGANPRGIKTMEVFTVVDTLPTNVNTFRPPACGTAKPIYTTADINYALLPNYTPPFNHLTSSFPLDITTPKKGLTRFWMDRYMKSDGVGAGDASGLSGTILDDYMEWYPRDLGVNLGRLAIFSMFNHANAQILANRLVQYAIEQKGVASQTNWSWGDWGAGYGVGRMLPYLYGGWLLEESSFTDIVKLAGPSNKKFGEDQSFYSTTTPFSGYAVGYPVSFTGPNYPLHGDFYTDLGVNHSGRDPAAKYNGVGGLNSNPGPPNHVINRYQACDGGGTGNQIMYNAGGYMHIQGWTMSGEFIWSGMAGQLGNWGNQDAVQFMRWWCHDANLAMEFGKDPASNYYRDIYQYGGTGDTFHKYCYETYVA